MTEENSDTDEDVTKLNRRDFMAAGAALAGTAAVSNMSEVSSAAEFSSPVDFKGAYIGPDGGKAGLGAKGWLYFTDDGTGTIYKHDGSGWVALGIGGESSVWEDSNGDGFYSLKSGAGISVDEGLFAERPWADVTQYGAVGDGTTGDSTALNDAASAAASAGRAVYLPPGNDYYITSDVTVPAGVEIFGPKDATVVADGAEIVVQNDDVTLRGFSIATQNASFGVRHDGGNNFTAENLFINCNTSTDTGINCRNGDHIRIRDCEVIDPDQLNGIDIVRNANNVRVEGNTVRRTGRCGIQLFENITDAVIRDNTIEGWMQRRDYGDGGINIYGPDVEDVRIIDNYLDTTTTDAAYANGHAGIVASGSKNVSVRGNQFVVRSSQAVQAFAGYRRQRDDGSYALTEATFENNKVRVDTTLLTTHKASGTSDVTFQNTQIRREGGSVDRFLTASNSEGALAVVDCTDITTVDRFVSLGDSCSFDDVIIEGNAVTVTTGPGVTNAGTGNFNRYHFSDNNLRAENDQGFHVRSSIQNLIITDNIIEASGAAIGQYSAPSENKVEADNITKGLS